MQSKRIIKVVRLVNLIESLPGALFSCKSGLLRTDPFRQLVGSEIGMAALRPPELGPLAAGSFPDRLRPRDYAPAHPR